MLSKRLLTKKSGFNTEAVRNCHWNWCAYGNTVRWTCEANGPYFTMYAQCSWAHVDVKLICLPLKLSHSYCHCPFHPFHPFSFPFCEFVPLQVLLRRLLTLSLYPVTTNSQINVLVYFRYWRKSALCVYEVVKIALFTWLLSWWMDIAEIDITGIGKLHWFHQYVCVCDICVLTSDKWIWHIT